MHNKVSSKANLAHTLRPPDEMYVFCSLRETTSNVLFICPTHREIWVNYFSLVFRPLKIFSLGKAYEEVMALNHSEYCLLGSALWFLIFEAFTCVITANWQAKWSNYFDSVDFDNQSVVDRAMINLRHLSSLNVCKYIYIYIYILISRDGSFSTTPDLLFTIDILIHLIFLFL